MTYLSNLYERTKQPNRRAAVKLQVKAKLKGISAIAAIVVALIAIFPLSGWAEASSYHHAIQHVLIFMAGAGLVGAVLPELSQRAKGDK